MSLNLIATMRIYLAISFALFLALCSEQVLACDTDAECGVGGTCIKREKRGRGVCYGGDLGSGPNKSAAQAPGSLPSSESLLEQTNINENSGSDAPIYGEEGYVEPNTQPRIIDRLDVQGAADSACVASSDCAGGQECIYRDPMLGHGLCEAPPE